MFPVSRMSWKHGMMRPWASCLTNIDIKKISHSRWYYPGTFFLNPLCKKWVSARWFRFGVKKNLVITQYKSRLIGRRVPPFMPVLLTEFMSASQTFSVFVDIDFVVAD